MSFTKILPSLAATYHSASAKFFAAVANGGGTAGADMAFLGRNGKNCAAFPWTFNPHLAKIVFLCEQLRNSLQKEAGPVFHFSSSMSNTLCSMVLCCRGHGTRRRALELPRRQNAHETFCSSRLGCAIAGVWAKNEEALG
ncbi:hypothetical protein MY10362_009732 [Beauveria mimosiformis]